MFVSTDFSSFHFSCCRTKLLSTHTRFNKDRILSKPPFYMIFPFVSLFSAFFYTLGTSQFYMLFLRNVVIFVAVVMEAVVHLHLLSRRHRWHIDDGFFSFCSVCVCVCHLLYIARGRCVFYEYENHARDMPEDGRAIDYYVIRSHTTFFLSIIRLPILTGSFLSLVFHYNTKSLLVFFSSWFSLSYCGFISFTLHFDAWIVEKKTLRDRKRLSLLWLHSCWCP